MIHIANLIAEIILMILKEGLNVYDATMKVSKESGIDYKLLYNKIQSKYK